MEIHPRGYAAILRKKPIAVKTFIWINKISFSDEDLSSLAIKKPSNDARFF